MSSKLDQNRRREDAVFNGCLAMGAAATFFGAIALSLSVMILVSEAKAEGQSSNLKATATVVDQSTIDPVWVMQSPDTHAPEKSVNVHRQTIERENDSVVLVTVTF